MMTFQINCIRIASTITTSSHGCILKWENTGTESHAGQYGGNLEEKHPLAWIVRKDKAPWPQATMRSRDDGNHSVLRILEELLVSYQRQHHGVLEGEREKTFDSIG